MSAEQQRPGSALTGGLEGRGIQPRVQDHATFTSSPHLMPPPNSARRPRACVACKESKVRCKRDEERPGDSCERCVSGGRQCIVTASARNKRPRRNISNVASLETKVDALVAALKEKQAVDVEEHRVGSPDDSISEPHAQSMYKMRCRSMRHDEVDADQAASSSAPTKRDHMTRRRTLQAEHQYSFAFFLPRPPEPDKALQEDVIDQGLISLEEAEECFARFTEFLLPHFPVVVFPPGAVASTVRKTKPILFLAILGAASGFLGDGVRKTLVEEVMRTYSDRIIMSGYKNLDLLQAIQVSAVWYFPPERFDEVKVYQLIHMAAIMAIELDFVRATRPSTSRLSLLKDGELGRLSLIKPAPKEPQSECQRALLCCYILCGVAFMVTRRPNLMRWTPYMDECVKALEEPSVAVKSDIFICQWVRSQQIVEEVGRHFMNEPSANVDISDLSVQYILRGYEQQFDRWKAQIPPEILRPILQSEASIVNLYLHEIFLHDGHNIKEFAAPLTEEYPVPASGIIPQPLNATHRKALAICIVSVKDVLDIFLSFDTETLCSIPTFQYVRTAYTVFAMMKIYFAASRLDSEFHEMMNTDLNVEFYLDELLKSLQEVSRTKKIRVAAIFRLVLLMLRTWFQRQKSQTGLDRGHVRRDDTILHTVLRTVDAIDADGNLHDGSSRAEDIEMAHTSFPIQTTAENVVRSSVDSWPLEPDEEMLPWSEFDFESFLEKDDSMLLQIALERFGGLIG